MLATGICYRGSSNSLKGCINDTKNILRSLCGLAQFSSSPSNTRVLTEDPDAFAPPTRANILEGCRWLVQGARRGDVLMFYYSGHGTTRSDVNGDENDGADEAICPLSGGVILDDELNQELAQKLPAGVTLFCIFDCCHSGTIMDLELVIDPQANSVLKETNAPSNLCEIYCLSGSLAVVCRSCVRCLNSSFLFAQV